VSYEQKKREHDEMMARIRAELNGDDPREAIITKLRAELAAMTTRAETAEAALESLTPGGSEFHGSPANCAEWIGKRMANVMRCIKERKAAEAKLELVSDYVAYYVTAWEPFEAAGGEGPEPLDFEAWLQAHKEGKL
jgi:hypothetical protein